MRIEIDTDAAMIVLLDGGEEKELPLYSDEAFAVLSRLWVTAGWGVRYTYGFTWLGRPIIQLPEDLIVVQEVIHRTRPDVIIETGVAHGGSLVFYASLFAAMGAGRVIGVDIEIRPHNRAAIESHALAPAISLVEGDSTSSETIESVRALLREDDRVMVVLDSNHSKKHVLAELDAYATLVSPDCYLVATDGVMEWLEGVPGAAAGWAVDNPKAAVEAWLPDHPEFTLDDPPPFSFNEGQVSQRVTYWPSAYLRRA